MEHRGNYIGRFAPSPTGPLHFGSMVMAVGSYLQARSQGGRWYVRMEDLDPPREVPGAADAILRTLEGFGLTWDGEVLYQSQRSELYIEALAQLKNQGMLYPCLCTRKEITERCLSGLYGPIYDGLCRHGTTHHPAALRIITHDSPISFVDRLRGHYSQQLQSELGDFVVQRADKLFAYQLAVVVDDAAQGITEIVRGSDLLDNTPRQIHLQQLLGFDTPEYVHLPLALNELGQKLSKQNGAQNIEQASPALLIYQALTFLGQTPPAELKHGTIDELWEWAIRHWQLNKVPVSDQPCLLEQIQS